MSPALPLFTVSLHRSNFDLVQFQISSQTAIGNGGRTDKYVWIQQLSDLTVNIPVPEGTKTKMLDIKLTNNRLSVCEIYVLFSGATPCNPTLFVCHAVHVPSLSS